VKLENILLGVLARHPSTGYDLKKYLDVHGRFLRPNTQMSQVYRTLAAMEANEWVAHTVESRPGATDAKTYRLTDEGMTVFLDWLNSPYIPSAQLPALILDGRLAFPGFLTREQVLHLVDAELAARREAIAKNRFRNRDLGAAETDAPFDAPLAELIGEWSHRVGASTMDHHVAALEQLRAILLDTPEDAGTEEYLARLAPPLPSGA